MDDFFPWSLRGWISTDVWKPVMFVSCKNSPLSEADDFPCSNAPTVASHARARYSETSKSHRHAAMEERVLHSKNARSINEVPSMDTHFILMIVRMFAWTRTKIHNFTLGQGLSISHSEEHAVTWQFKNYFSAFGRRKWRWISYSGAGISRDVTDMYTKHEWGLFLLALNRPSWFKHKRVGGRKVFPQ